MADFGITDRWELITPAIAQEMLENNIANNRKVRPARVNEFAADMAAGKWVKNGEAVQISDTGKLLNGQHRLLACIKSGVSFWCLVVRGLPENVFSTIDRGQQKSVGQVLHTIAGVGDYNLVAAVINWIYRFEHGYVLQKRKTSLTADGTLDVLKEHPALVERAAYAVALNKRFKMGAGSVIAFCYYIFSLQNKERADQFFDSLVIGADLREIDPVFHLRNLLIRRGAGTTHALTPYEVCAFFFKTWLAFMEGRTLTDLRWRTGDEFPNIGPVPGFSSRPESKNLPPRKDMRKAPFNEKVRALAGQLRSLDRKRNNRSAKTSTL
jgi:hypothetical protein